MSGQRMMSCSLDRTVRVWSLDTWAPACVQTVEAYPAGSPQFIKRLAVSGSTLVGGSSSDLDQEAEEHEVRVWDLETLQPLHTLSSSVELRMTVCSGKPLSPTANFDL